MLRPLLLSLLLCTAPLSGCLDVERPCPENTCFPLTSSALNSILDELGEIDALELAEEYDSLRVKTTRSYSEGGISGKIEWDVSKDDSRKIRLIGNRVVVGGVEIAGYEIWDGGPNTFTRTSGDWLMGRDMFPNYEDPFIELARLATDNPDGSWPPFRFDLSGLSSLSWTITGDALDLFQIARATNGSQEIYLEIHGSPPRIVSIEVYEGALAQEDLIFEMRIWNDDWQSEFVTEYYTSMLEGKQLLELLSMPEFQRAPVRLIPIPDYQSVSGDTTSVIGVVPSGMTHEATLSEIEMHIFSGNFSVASLMLNEGESNTTSGDGVWWELLWVDAGHPGLLSEFDTYSVKTNSDDIFEIRIFDHWAQSWSDTLQ